MNIIPLFHQLPRLFDKFTEKFEGLDLLFWSYTRFTWSEFRVKKNLEIYWNSSQVAPDLDSKQVGQNERICIRNLK